MRTLVIIYILIQGIVGDAAAANIPEYDIKNSCRELASLDDGNVIIERQCRQDESTAKAHIARMNVPEDIIERCHENIVADGQGMYIILEQCIQKELQKK